MELRTLQGCASLSRPGRASGDGGGRAGAGLAATFAPALATGRVIVAEQNDAILKFEMAAVALLVQRPGNAQVAEVLLDVSVAVAGLTTMFNAQECRCTRRSYQ